MYSKFNKILAINLAICSFLGMGETTAFAQHVNHHVKHSVNIVNYRNKHNVHKLSLRSNVKRHTKGKRINKSKRPHISTGKWFAVNSRRLIKAHSSASLFVNSIACHLFHEGEGDAIGNTTFSSGGAFMNNIESFTRDYREGWIISRARYFAYSHKSKKISVAEYQRAANQYNDGFKLTKKHKLMFAASGRRLKGPGVGAVSTNGYHWSYLRD